MSHPHPRRVAGLLIPVFSLRTAHDLGIGDTSGLRDLIDWSAAHGIGLIQVLPVNETSDDNSPYNAISSLALEPLTLSLAPADLPDLSPARYRKLAPPATLAALRSGPVRYREVRAVKSALLDAAFTSFERTHLRCDTPRALAFRAFLDAQSAWLPDYSLFRVLMERNQGWPVWERWPAAHRSPDAARAWLLGLEPAEAESVRRRQTYHAYVQWLAFTQWNDVKTHATQRGVQLMGDIPFGVGRCSADVWAYRGLFDLDWSGGAPPEKVFKVDPFTEKWGQNWGIPLYRWDVMRSRGFDWWRLRVGTLRQAFHLFRIDHVLGFYRIYSFPWQPWENDTFLPLDEAAAAARTGGRLPGFRQHPDDNDHHKHVNRSQGDELLRMVQDAAGDVRVVAEDLGMVPDYVPGHLASLGIPGFRIPAFWRNHDGTYQDPAHYPALSLATPATHDFPPLALEWETLWQRVERGGEEGEAARRELQAQARFAGLDTPPRDFSPALHEGWLRAVLGSASEMAVFMVTDLFADPARFNTPGAVSDDNWTWRLPVPVRDLDQQPALLDKVRRFAALIESTGRISSRM